MWQCKANTCSGGATSTKRCSVGGFGCDGQSGNFAKLSALRRTTWTVLQVWHLRALGQRVCSGAAAAAAVAAAVATAALGGTADGSNAADSAHCGTTARTTISSVSPPPPPVWGGSRRWGPSQRTRPSPRAAHTMHLGPRRTPAADARKCIGAGNPVRPGRMDSPSNHNRNHSPSPPVQPQPQPVPQPQPQPAGPARPLSRRGGGDDERHADGMAITLWYLATTVTDLWPQPAALAVHRWAEGTVSHWIRELRALGRTALLHHKATAAEALVVHITTMAAQGRRSATLRAVVSSVRMAERLELVPPTVRPLHWLLCEAADRLYRPRPPRRVWATEDIFRTIADGGLAGDTLTAVAALAAAHCWRVSEAASIRPADLATPYRVRFYDFNVRNKYITARTCPWG